VLLLLESATPLHRQTTAQILMWVLQLHVDCQRETTSKQSCWSVTEIRNKGSLPWPKSTSSLSRVFLQFKKVSYILHYSTTIAPTNETTMCGCYSCMCTVREETKKFMLVSNSETRNKGNQVYHGQ
jgi:hypothetical protein